MTEAQNEVNILDIKSITWNCEGLSRNKFNLKQIVDLEKPSFIFLSESWTHLPDSLLATDTLNTDFCFYLNSEDRHDELLSLHNSRAHGGTMTLWRKELDPYVTILEPTSSRILVLVLDVPGFQVSIHINIYLPTAGKEEEFMEQLALLEDTIDHINEKYADSVLYIRGDANASPSPRNDNNRDKLFNFFLTSNNLKYVPTDHHTYHHFMNSGYSDSSIDVLLESETSSEGFPNNNKEKLIKILCKKSNHLVDSSHDVLVSAVSFPRISVPSTPMEENITANRVTPTKHRISWSEEGIISYQELLLHALPPLQDDLPGDLNPGTASVIFQLTNHILTTAAKLTNKHTKASTKPGKKRALKTPFEISVALKAKERAHKELLHATPQDESEKEDIKNTFKEAKAAYQNMIRKYNNEKEIKRDQDFLNLLSKNPSQVFKSIKSEKKSQNKRIKSLKVGDKLYSDEHVPDGFFDSISSLKTLPPIEKSVLAALFIAYSIRAVV